ncbi:TPA: DUF4113 domain-containing protein [Klebsiella pneumoniae]|nr:DUF4113 domain-containing protein [Klebsiella pneumoniae]
MRNGGIFWGSRLPPHSGLGKVWFAGRGIAPDWQMKRDLLSPAYTTRWADIPSARLC